MSLNVVGSFTLGQINVAASLLGPMVGQLDIAVSGAFGFSALLGDLQAQFSAALAANAAIKLSFINPLATIAQTLAALVQVQATLKASINLPAFAFPSVSFSANAAIIASLGFKLGGIRAMISGMLAVKIPVIPILAALGAGPVYLMSFGVPFDTLGGVGVQVQSQFTAGLPGILPGEQVYGVILLTKSPAAWVALQATMRVS
jgi:hypothetical protein